MAAPPFGDGHATLGAAPVRLANQRIVLEALLRCRPYVRLATAADRAATAAAATAAADADRTVKRGAWNVLLTDEPTLDVGFGPEPLFVLLAERPAGAFTAHAQLLNHLPNVGALTSRIGLIRALHRRYSARAGGGGSGGGAPASPPHVFDTVPCTYFIPAGSRAEAASPTLAQCLRAVHACSHGAHDGLRMPPKHCASNLWVVKPAVPGRGRDVVVVAGAGAVRTAVEARPGEDLVVQKLVERPLTVAGGRKATLRLWVAVVDTGDVFVHSHGYLMLAPGGYSAAPSLALPHATPALMARTHVASHTTTTAPGAAATAGGGAGCDSGVMSLAELAAALVSAGVAGDSGAGARFPADVLTSLVLPACKRMIVDAVVGAWAASQPPLAAYAPPGGGGGGAGGGSAHPRVGHRNRRSYELLGADFQLDEDLRPWLLGLEPNPTLAPPPPPQASGGGGGAAAGGGAGGGHAGAVWTMAQDLVATVIDPLLPPPASLLAELAASSDCSGSQQEEGGYPPSGLDALGALTWRQAPSVRRAAAGLLQRVARPPSNAAPRPAAAPPPPMLPTAQTHHAATSSSSSAVVLSQLNSLDAAYFHHRNPQDSATRQQQQPQQPQQPQAPLEAGALDDVGAEEEDDAHNSSSSSGFELIYRNPAAPDVEEPAYVAQLHALAVRVLRGRASAGLAGGAASTPAGVDALPPRSPSSLSAATIRGGRPAASTPPSRAGAAVNPVATGAASLFAGGTATSALVSSSLRPVEMTSLAAALGVSAHDDITAAPPPRCRTSVTLPASALLGPRLPGRFPALAWSNSLQQQQQPPLGAPSTAPTPPSGSVPGSALMALLAAPASTVAALSLVGPGSGSASASSGGGGGSGSLMAPAASVSSATAPLRGGHSAAQGASQLFSTPGGLVMRHGSLPPGALAAAATGAQPLHSEEMMSFLLHSGGGEASGAPPSAHYSRVAPTSAHVAPAPPATMRERLARVRPRVDTGQPPLPPRPVPTSSWTAQQQQAAAMAAAAHSAPQRTSGGYPPSRPLLSVGWAEQLQPPSSHQQQQQQQQQQQHQAASARRAFSPHNRAYSGGGSGGSGGGSSPAAGGSWRGGTPAAQTPGRAHDLLQQPPPHTHHASGGGGAPTSHRSSAGGFGHRHSQPAGDAVHDDDDVLTLHRTASGAVAAAAVAAGVVPPPATPAARSPRDSGAASSAGGAHRHHLQVLPQPGFSSQPQRGAPAVTPGGSRGRSAGATTRTGAVAGPAAAAAARSSSLSRTRSQYAPGSDSRRTTVGAPPPTATVRRSASGLPPTASARVNARQPMQVQHQQQQQQQQLLQLLQQANGSSRQQAQADAVRRLAELTSALQALVAAKTTAVAAAPPSTGSSLHAAAVAATAVSGGAGGDPRNVTTAGAPQLRPAPLAPIPAAAQQATPAPSSPWLQPVMAASTSVTGSHVSQHSIMAASMAGGSQHPVVQSSAPAHPSTPHIMRVGSTPVAAAFQQQQQQHHQPAYRGAGGSSNEYAAYTTLAPAARAYLGATSSAAAAPVTAAAATLKGGVGAPSAPSGGGYAAPSASASAAPAVSSGGHYAPSALTPAAPASASFSWTRPHDASESRRTLSPQAVSGRVSFRGGERGRDPDHAAAAPPPTITSTAAASAFRDTWAGGVLPLPGGGGGGGSGMAGAAAGGRSGSVASGGGAREQPRPSHPPADKASRLELLLAVSSPVAVVRSGSSRTGAGAAGAPPLAVGVATGQPPGGGGGAPPLPLRAHPSLWVAVPAPSPGAGTGTGASAAPAASYYYNTATRETTWARPTGDGVRVMTQADLDVAVGRHAVGRVG